MEVINDFLQSRGIYSLVMILFFWAFTAWCSAKII